MSVEATAVGQVERQLKLGGGQILEVGTAYANVTGDGTGGTAEIYLVIKPLNARTRDLYWPVSFYFKAGPNQEGYIAAWPGISNTAESMVVACAASGETYPSYLRDAVQTLRYAFFQPPTSLAIYRWSVGFANVNAAPYRFGARYMHLIAGGGEPLEWPKDLALP